MYSTKKAKVSEQRDIMNKYKHKDILWQKVKTHKRQLRKNQKKH